MPRWWKRMSRTDAQQPTKGYLVAFLRMTGGEEGSDAPDSLFPHTQWTDGHFGKNDVEEAHEDFEIVDDSRVLGNYNLLLTYDHERPRNHAHPALWIHWGDELQEYLRANDREGWYVIVERNPPDAAAPPLTITFQRDQPV